MLRVSKVPSDTKSEILSIRVPPTFTTPAVENEYFHTVKDLRPKAFTEAVSNKLALRVIDDLINELQLLKSVYSSFVGNYEVTQINYASIENRFAKITNFGTWRISMAHTNMHKLQKDVATILFLLDAFVREVTKYGTCVWMKNYITNMIRMQEDEEELMIQLETKRRKLRNMRLDLKCERKLSISLKSGINSILTEALTYSRETMERYLAEVKYITMWEESRDEQNCVKLKRKEKKYADLSETMSWKIEQEDRCHEQFRTFIEESQEEYMDSIEKWMEEYDTTLERKENEIYNLNAKLEKLRDTYSELKETYENRIKEIDDWLEYKRKKMEEEKLLAQLNAAAIKIQAWWRGVMVRRKLGPYRRKAKKGKGKNKNKANKTDGSKKRKS